MRCAVLGSPINHSLSPAMHRAAYAELGLDWAYDAVEVEAGMLATFLGALGDDVRGFSVTAPLKREAADVAQLCSTDVELLGIANTLVVDDGIVHASNTDIGGVVGALREHDLRTVGSARIVGGGATAVSVVQALTTMGVSRVEIVVRDLSRGQDAADAARGAGTEVRIRSFDEPMIDKVDLLVSTVPGEAIGSRSHELVESSRAVLDVVYDPWPTALASAAADAHLAVVSGLDLLAHQAALQVELMTGSPVSPQFLRTAGLAELAAR